MPNELVTARLALRPLSAAQLALLRSDRAALAKEFGLTIAEGILTGNAPRAIALKLAKMEKLDAVRHPWHTYWLIVIKAERIGAGLIGFKGYPDAEGRTEAGYGIAETYQSQGYMTEALKALTDWAFTNPDCRALTAKGVVNPASARVLQKSGWRQVRRGPDGSSDWELHRS